MRNHRGFTLIELMVGLVIMLIVTGAIYTLLNTTQRVSRAQAERTDLQSNVRAAAIVIPNELREINTVEGAVIPGPQVDILAKSATSITYRAMRGMGYVCQTPASDEIRVRASTWTGLRNPVALRDSAYVFREGDDPDQGADDTWQPVRISAVDLGSTCGAIPAYRFTINPTVAALTVPLIPVGTPVRLYEVMELSLYASGGQSWLGARSVSASELSPQPVLGPLVDGSGLAFEYLDKNGNTTATSSDIKSVRLTIRGISDNAITTRGGSGVVQHVQDRLVSEIQLRNAFRP